jgi:hypothetical protein
MLKSICRNGCLHRSKDVLIIITECNVKRHLLLRRPSKYCMIPPTGGIQNDFNILMDTGES